MNHLLSLRALGIAAIVVALPATALCDDHHSHSSGGRGRYYSSRCYPGYRGYGFAPYFYGPSIGFGFYSAPAYYYGYDTPDYDYDAPPRAAYYRGVPVAPSRGSSSDALAVDVQRALARRGFYHGEIDGEIGAGTRAAIRSYQYSRGLTVTGRIDAPLIRALGLG